ncbi:putative sulfite reductase [NADPH] flavoprotein alpha-component [Actinobacillus pleuropneumoniae]|nr:putative sulfite reductase [NADPH] flavoprotein alpha-component [Actinobacillus pleuropneumoniae]KIE88362.1 putative sulfite reductase [NADPH] flavoprotein alpha-component [Actinobacillus pleuropneumoniae]
MSLKTTGELPLSAETVQVLANLDHLQLAWLSGYAWAKAQSTNSIGENFAKDSSNLTALVASEPLKVTVLSASQTGNAKSVADKLAERLTAEGVNVVRTSLKDYKAKNIADEQLVLLVTSTQGEGEAPEEGVVLLKLLNGKKAPKLDRLQFAVLGLGDSSYPNFCQAGKDFDQRFYDLGATRLFERVDADLDFQATADQWINEIVEIIKAKNNEGVAANLTPNASQTPVVTNQSKYNKANPFPATLITNQRITAKDAEKDVRHLEFDLSGSGLSYQSGDVLGVYFENDPALAMKS